MKYLEGPSTLISLALKRSTFIAKKGARSSFCNTDKANLSGQTVDDLFHVMRHAFHRT